MEAANMGAYLAGEPRERLDRALELISSESPHAKEFRNEFEDTYAPKLVLREFGEPKAMPRYIDIEENVVVIVFVVGACAFSLTLPW